MSKRKGVQPTEREAIAMNIALAGADVKGLLDGSRNGKNGYVVRGEGENLWAGTQALTAAIAHGGRNVRGAWDNFLKALEGLPPEQATSIEEAALLFAGICSSVGGEVSRMAQTANRSYNSRDADLDDDMQLIEDVDVAPGKRLKDRLASVMEKRGYGSDEFESFKRHYYRVKKRLHR